jgi:hypothetical protein
MQNSLTFGRRLVLTDQIVCVEPFDSSTQPDLKSDRPYRSRVILLDRTSVLSEDLPEVFVANQKFHLVVEDQIAINPAVSFWVETFTLTEGFKPEKDYNSRLKWRDAEGRVQSKLFVASAEVMLAAVTRNEPGQRKPRPARMMPGRRVRKIHAAQS